jgi:flavin reductase (DIM6/NTAB) family NADH-FMN oxidoreductase RutF
LFCRHAANYQLLALRWQYPYLSRESGFIGTDSNMEPHELSANMLNALRRYAKSVMVISSRHQGIRYAMAATAVCEVSLDPPAMLVCVNLNNSMHVPLSDGANFAVNMLHGGQVQIAQNAGGAVRGEERFNEGDWRESVLGIPYLADAQASFICRNVRSLTFGTHTIFIGEVAAAYAAEAVDPLIYVDGGYLSSRTQL